jgi:tetratricopeptide (TPR) repeat protein
MRRRCAAAGRADAGYQAARDTLNRMTGRVQNRRLGDIPQLRSCSTKLLEDALKVYQGVFAGADDPDPAVRFDTAVAYQQAGGIQIILGRGEAAAENMRRSVELLEGLPVEDQESPLVLDVLAGCCNALGLLHRDRREVDEARRYHERAIEASERLIRASSRRPERPRTPGRERARSGDVHLANRPAEAESHYRRAAEIRTNVLRDHPGRRACRPRWGGSHQPRVALSGHEASDRSNDRIREGRGAAASLVARQPASASSLAILHINWSYLLRTEKKLQVALQRLDEAVKLAEGARRAATRRRPAPNL